MSFTVERAPFIITTGQLQPSIADTITLNGETVDMTGAVVSFFLRALISRTPINLAGIATPIVPADQDGHNVLFNWGIGDTAIEGEYMGWWGYIPVNGALIETPEFRVVITDHGPGFGTSTGAIVDAISQWMPVTLNHLRQEPSFGDRFLQRHADYIKRTVMGTIVAPDDEILWDPVIVDYLAKRTCLRLITPAKDYWGRQNISVNAQSPVERATYPDMLKNLDALDHRLRCELPQDLRQIQFLGLSFPVTRVEPRPLSSLGDPAPNNFPTTPDPRETRRPRTGGPRWGGIYMP